MTEYLQLVIAAVIVAMVLYVVWNRGRANPVDTGTLEREVARINGRLKPLEDLPEAIRPIRHKTNNLDMKMTAIEGMIAKQPTTATLMEFEREVEGRLVAVETKVAAAATGEELEAVRGAVGKVQTSIEHVCKQNERTDAKIDRIEAILMKDVKIR